jgi:hypothetical protein
MGFFSDLISGVGEVVTAPVKWAGDIVEKTGEVTGIDPLHSLGEGVSDFAKNETVQQLAGLAAAIAAGYYGPQVFASYQAASAAGASAPQAAGIALGMDATTVGLPSGFQGLAAMDATGIGRF